MKTVNIVVVMGVSGCGKSTVGRLLAQDLGWQFADADDYHSPQNKAKMERGEALTDGDRAPWLQALNGAIFQWHTTQQSAVLACSALKQDYRRRLTPTGVSIQWVYLHGSFETIQQRLQERQQSEPEHFMSPQLLQSQFDVLEEPEEAIWLDVKQSPSEIVRRLTIRVTR